jgi:hypothetical protein
MRDPFSAAKKIGGQCIQCRTGKIKYVTPKMEDIPLQLQAHTPVAS